MRNIYWIILFFISIIFLSGKEISAVAKKEISEKKYSVVDSLNRKTFDELQALFDVHQNDSILIKKIALAYLFKANNHKNNVEIANGYRMFFEININNPEVALMYTDSMINITKGIKDKYYPARGYLLKGYVLQGLDRYYEALESYLLSKKHAETNQNMDHIIAIKHNIAILKTTLGKDHEALTTYKENFDFLITQDINKKFRPHYIATLYKLSDSYNRLKKYDSANFYVRKGITSSLSEKKHYYYSDLLSCYGVNSYYRKKYTTAIDSLKKSARLSKKIDNANLLVTYLYLGKTLLKLKKEEEAIAYLKKVDSSISISNYILETREAFTLLIDHYKNNSDKSNQLKIMEKLIVLDNSFNVKYKKLNINIVKDYDNKKLVKAKEQLIESIENQNKTVIYRLLIFGILTIASISALYFYYFRKRKIKYEKVYDEKLINAQNLSKKKAQKTKDIELAPELKLEILSKLEDFEKNRVFLKNDLTMSIVAKSLKTNSTYLSKIINLDKQKNFANYINDLRIEYCMKQMENDKKFRKYSITSMANEVGFNNIQSFVKAFHKKNGCNPTEYIKSRSYSS